MESPFSNLMLYFVLHLQSLLANLELKKAFGRDESKY